MNKYLFLPRSSCHDKNTFGGLVHGKVRRALLRNRDFKSAQHYIHLLEHRLRKRGYVTSEIRPCIARAIRLYNWPRSTHKEHNRNTVFFRVQCSSSLSKPRLKACFDKYASLMNHRIVFAASVQRSIFRLRYRSNWSTSDCTPDAHG